MRSERHWSIYLPALSVSVLWAGILLWSDWREPPLLTLRVLAFMVEAFIVPLLYVWAFFRGRGAEVRVTSQNLFVSTGGRRPEKIGVELALVDGVRVARSFLQKLVGAGSLEIRLAGGRRLILNDMGNPEGIAEAINAAKLKMDRRDEEDLSAEVRVEELKHQ